MTDIFSKDINGLIIRISMPQPWSLQYMSYKHQMKTYGINLDFKRKPNLFNFNSDHIITHLRYNYIWKTNSGNFEGKF